MGNVDMRFRYTNAADSSRPGYLQRRFIAIRKQQAEAKAQQEAEAAAVAAEQTVKVRKLGAK